jgi:pimeloyl-ACP methyl ester carboxylesterase
LAGFAGKRAVPKGAALLFWRRHAGDGIRWIAFLALAGLSACAGVDRFGGSRQAVVDWGRERGFAASPAQSGGLRLLALQRIDTARPVTVLHVYIEGDGAAWSSPFNPPRDPTPLEPVALALAAADPAPAVAYLGRPCQYLEATELAGCAPDYWTGSRFAPEVVDSFMAHLDRLKQGSGTRRLRLFGYSGGGVLATLLAARRDDVEHLVTVAAPLAVAEWASLHQLTPLAASLDPMVEARGRLPPATYFVGGRDEVVPERLVAAFAARNGGRLRVVPEFDHRCCWSRDWRRLLEEVR